MPDDDTGWGGTVEDGWASTIQPSPPLAPFSPVPPAPPAPGPSSYTPGPPPYTPGPSPKSGRGRRQAIAAAALVAIAGVVVAVVVSTTGSTPSKTSSRPPVTSPPVVGASASAYPTPTGSKASTLLGRAPFSGCVVAPTASYNTPAVADQIVCTGLDVSSSVSAQGVSYAQFNTQSDLNAWYSDSILKANSINPDAGNCVTGVTTNTSGGASYCEGAFTDSNGTTARQLVALSPGSINFRNGPNSTAADCQGSSYTLLIFTSPDDKVGVVALSCSATSATARAMESALSAGSFDLN